jgi:hypothetical protein
MSIFCRRSSHTRPLKSITVPVLLLVGIVKVHNLYLNPKIVNTKFLVLTSYIAPVEYSMHTNGFRYKKCIHFTVGAGNVYLNPR